MSELLSPPTPPHGIQMSRTTKDLTAGTVGGITQVLVGQPFDIVKVRIQTAPAGTYTGALDCAARVLKNDGPLGFWKGSLVPLVGIGACVSIQFGALEFAKRHFKSTKLPGKDLGFHELWAAGAFAGVANSVVAGPVEHVRIRLQTQPATTPRLYAGPVDCVSKLYRSGGIAGVFKGQVSTMWRDGFGYGCYFMAYEALVQRHLNTYNVKREDISPLYAVTYGALAGFALWASIYPVDVVKSKLQTDSLDPSKRVYKGMLDCASKVWKAQGWRGFTGGLAPTLIRSPFANGCTFVAFELTMRALG